MHREHRGLLYALLASVANSISALFIKLAVVIPNEEIVFFRFLISLLFILPGLFLGRVNLQIKQFPKHLLRGLTGIAAIYCFFYSVKHLPLVAAMTIFNTAPLFMPLVIFLWLKIIIPKMRIWALIIGFIGVLITLRPGSGLGQWDVIIGLLGALFSALAQVGVRQLSRMESTETIITYYFILAVIVSFPPFLLTWTPIEEPILWVYLLVISLTSLIFQFCFVKALTHAPVTKVGTLTYMGIVFSGLLGWLVFNEIPKLWTICGTAFIIMGGLFALFSKEPPRKRKRHLA